MSDIESTKQYCTPLFVLPHLLKTWQSDSKKKTPRMHFLFLSVISVLFSSLSYGKIEVLRQHIACYTLRVPSYVKRYRTHCVSCIVVFSCANFKISAAREQTHVVLSYFVIVFINVYLSCLFFFKWLFATLELAWQLFFPSHYMSNICLSSDYGLHGCFF